MSREHQPPHAQEDWSGQAPHNVNQQQDAQRIRLAFCIALYGILFLIWFAPLPSRHRAAMGEQRQAAAPRHAVLVPPVDRPDLVMPRPQQHARLPVPLEQPVSAAEPIIEPFAVEVEHGPAEEEDWFVETPAAPSPTDQVLIVGTPGLQEPVITKRVKPSYPPQGAAMRLQGYVVLQAILRRDGSVDEVEVLRGLGKGKFGFEREAISSLLKWRFIPGSYNGEPADVRMNLRFDFVLD